MEASDQCDLVGLNGDVAPVAADEDLFMLDLVALDDGMDTYQSNGCLKAPGLTVDESMKVAEQNQHETDVLILCNDVGSRTNISSGTEAHKEMIYDLTAIDYGSDGLILPQECGCDNLPVHVPGMIPNNSDNCDLANDNALPVFADINLQDLDHKTFGNDMANNQSMGLFTVPGLISLDSVMAKEQSKDVLVLGKSMGHNLPLMAEQEREMKMVVRSSMGKVCSVDCCSCNRDRQHNGQDLSKYFGRVGSESDTSIQATPFGSNIGKINGELAHDPFHFNDKFPAIQGKLSSHIIEEENRPTLQLQRRARKKKPPDKGSPFLQTAAHGLVKKNAGQK